MPTVVQAIFSTHMAGTERHVADLAAALRSHGWNTVVATGRDASPRALEAYRKSAAEVFQLGGHGVSRGLELRRLMRSERASILHAHLGEALVAGAIATFGGAGVLITTVHFIRPRHMSRRGAVLRRLAYRLLLGRARGVVAISDAVAAAIPPPLPRRSTRIAVIHHGIPDAASAPFPRPPIVLYLGRLEEEKRVEVAIAAVAASAGAWDLWIAGAGDREATLRATAERIAKRRVRFLGFVDDIGDLLQGVSVLVMPSAAEPFGLAAVEALRAGTPVVAARSGALPEIVDPRCGLLLEPDDVQAWSASLDRLMADAARLQALGVGARERYETAFRDGRMAGCTAAFYAGSLAPRSTAEPTD